MATLYDLLYNFTKSFADVFDEVGSLPDLDDVAADSLMGGFLTPKLIIVALLVEPVSEAVRCSFEQEGQQQALGNKDRMDFEN